MAKKQLTRIISLSAVIALTIGIHYGWVMQPIFGDAHWIHALHGRFCYIPIVIAASWFGLRGGLITAGVVSLLVLPYIFGRELDSHSFAAEITELLFYFAIATLTGGLVDREFFARRKQEEAQLQAERSQKLSLVGQIAAGVAHEIKNPLASIKGAADIVSDETTSLSDKKEFREIMQNEIRRIDGTVTEFLKFARPRETILKQMNLSESVTACVRQLEAQARNEGISFTSNISNDVIINGDDSKIKQMTLNLLLNAVQASSRESIIRIDLGIIANNIAQLLVSDSGSGIDDRQLSRVFEPFYTTKASGTGLGLAIVKSTIESHNGKVQIINNDSGGVTVQVEFPIFADK